MTAERLAVGDDGLFVGEDPGRVVAGHLQVVGGPLPSPAAAKWRPRTAATSSRRSVARGLQVPGGARVQRPALGAQQAVVGRVPDQGVAEPVEGSGWRRASVKRPAETSSERASSSSPPSSLRAARAERPSLLAQHRRGHYRLPGGRAEPVGTGRGPGARAPRGRGPAAPRPSRQPPCRRERGRRCRAATRAAPPRTVGCRPPPRRRRRAPSSPTSPPSSERARARSVGLLGWAPSCRARKGRAGPAASSASSSPTPGSGSGRRVASTSSGPVAARRGQLGRQAERGGVGPVQVFQGEHGRALLEQAAEHRAHGREGGVLQFGRAHAPRCAPPGPAGRPISGPVPGRPRCPCRARRAPPPRGPGAAPLRLPPAVRR